MITLQAERPLDAEIFPGVNQSSASPTWAPQGALPSPRPDVGASPAIYVPASGDRDEAALVASPLVGLSIGLAIALYRDEWGYYVPAVLETREGNRRVRDARANPKAEEIKKDDAKDEREQPDDCDADKIKGLHDDKLAKGVARGKSIQ